MLTDRRQTRLDPVALSTGSQPASALAFPRKPAGSAEGSASMDDQILAQLLGRASAVEFAIGAIIRHLPPPVRDAVREDLRLFLERSDESHDSGRAVAEAARSMLKETGP
jgi:hypothetical protein